MSLANSWSRFEQASRARFEPLAAQAREAWQRRTPREQKLLKGGALLLGIALLWTAGLKPALESIDNARSQLPALQAQASRLNAVILEAKALDRGRSGAMSAEETEQALRASLGSAGLDALAQFGPHTDAEAGQAQWQVRFNNAPAGRIVEWLSSLPFVAQVQTRQAALERSVVDGRDRPGQLTGTIVLAMPSKEPR